MFLATWMVLISTLEKSCWAEASVARSRPSELNVSFFFMLFWVGLFIRLLGCTRGGSARRFIKGGIIQIQFVDHPFVAHHVDVALFVGGKRRNALGRSGDLPNGSQFTILLDDSPDALRRVIATDIYAIKGRGLVATIDVTARNRVAIFPFVGKYRRCIGHPFLAVVVRERFKSFIDVPAMVLAPSNDGNFFDAVLPNISDPEIAGHHIETESPWLAKAIGPNFGPRIGPASERVVSRDSVGKALIPMVHIYSQHFSQ